LAASFPVTHRCARAPPAGRRDRGEKKVLMPLV